MSKPYWSGTGRTGSSYLDDAESPTRRTSGGEYGEYAPGDYESSFYSSGGYRTTDEYRRRGSGRHPRDDHSDHHNDDYDGDDGDDLHYRSDNRWRWVAGLAVAVLLIAVLAIVMVMRSDETTPTAGTEAAPATSTTPRTVVATIPPSPAAPPAAQLAPETIVTITTTPSAAAVPQPEALPVAPPEAALPAPDTRTITYSVTGTRPLFDLVTIIYTDEQGLPRTDVNVTLPWTRTVALNPGVTFQSVTATSVSGQLNCAVTDAAGATLIAQTNNSMIATCTG
ncbi:hypothetical protein [Mycolicibacterium mengxianglii]|uniref:hypothetical protein n=1 Tax=Mycolicibacterium mengxianglii TaxID=2736649 RepID=UPI0018EECDF8|nr:hypothetical protein [Mycolicibacterium mengxianglii]